MRTSHCTLAINPLTYQIFPFPLTKLRLPRAINCTFARACDYRQNKLQRLRQECFDYIIFWFKIMNFETSVANLSLWFVWPVTFIETGSTWRDVSVKPPRLYYIILSVEYFWRGLDIIKPVNNVATIMNNVYGILVEH